MTATESMVRGSLGVRQLRLGGRNDKEDAQVQDVPEGNGAVRH